MIALAPATSDCLPAPQHGIAKPTRHGGRQQQGRSRLAALQQQLEQRVPPLGGHGRRATPRPRGRGIGGEQFHVRPGPHIGLQKREQSRHADELVRKRARDRDPLPGREHRSCHERDVQSGEGLPPEGGRESEAAQELLELYTPVATAVSATSISDE